jgi:hypothetical protein
VDGPFHNTGGSRGIEVVDIDQDGDIDVIVGSWSGGGDHILLNDGVAGLSLVDGELEGEGEAQVYNSVFAIEQHGQSTTTSIIAVDLDLDLDLDLLFCTKNGLNFVYMNEIAQRCGGQPFCTAGLKQVADSPFALAGGDGQGMATADLDDDGDQDVIVAVSGADDLMFLNDGNGNNP